MYSIQTNREGGITVEIKMLEKYDNPLRSSLEVQTPDSCTKSANIAHTA